MKSTATVVVLGLGLLAGCGGGGSGPRDVEQGGTAPITAGKYKAKVPQGKLRVFLQGTRETGRMIEVFGKQEPEVVSVIPRHYAAGIELDTSTLSGERHFELTSSPDSSR